VLLQVNICLTWMPKEKRMPNACTAPGHSPRRPLTPSGGKQLLVACIVFVVGGLVCHHGFGWSYLALLGLDGANGRWHSDTGAIVVLRKSPSPALLEKKVRLEAPAFVGKHPEDIPRRTSSSFADCSASTCTDPKGGYRIPQLWSSSQG
jgi:hypothetical protein